VGTLEAQARSGRAAAGEFVAILLDPGLESVAASLQEELGPGFAVVVWSPADRAGERSDAVHDWPAKPSQSVIAVLDATADPAASTAVARQRRRHPRAGMLVVASRSAAAATWRATADLLDAGADDVLTELNTLELAARLKALARRRAAAPAAPSTRMDDSRMDGSAESLGRSHLRPAR
jgi:DNA-binding response OmpR family regulator